MSVPNMSAVVRPAPRAGGSRAESPAIPVRGLEPPPLYGVWVLNNDVTPARLVVDVLVEAFGLDEDRAFTLMLVAHREDRAQVGRFTHDLATTLARRGRDVARQRGDHALAFRVART